MPCIEKRLSKAKSYIYKEKKIFHFLKKTTILKNNKIKSTNREKSSYLIMSKMLAYCFSNLYCSSIFLLKNKQE